MGWLVSDRGWLAIDMVSMGWLGSHESDYGWPVISTQIEGEKYTFSHIFTKKYVQGLCNNKNFADGRVHAIKLYVFLANVVDEMPQQMSPYRSINVTLVTSKSQYTFFLKKGGVKCKKKYCAF